MSVSTVAPLSAAVAGTAGTADATFAVLAARTALESDLAKRYTTDPLSVLAEFGPAAAEPVYHAGHSGLTIERLDGSGTVLTTNWTWRG
ncbi:hypothetical protein GL263_01255 [Streptomyces durbertensis]|uniref:Uncharacterized protein n=1 Tax=Streptomyces durbertensis TaxID=2448886 RepID=A0ABR6EA56_9ACTN|nr:hypothetical protein [Streptomyces durbertensis]MBB1242211.1 hypothetical protein [Streptomyces durbertensis]